jgi:hypothetical protein
MPSARFSSSLKGPKVAEEGLRAVKGLRCVYWKKKKKKNNNNEIHEQ